MFRKTITISLMAALVIFAGAIVGKAQSIERNYDDDYYERVRIDRHLDVEVWTDHYDGEYYNGDNIVVYFRANRDAFVSIYSIDTRGRVNLLFPADPTEDNYVRGGVSYSIPGEGADFDLEVNGPEGFENIQIVASRERFDIPNWYRNSGLVCDWDDRAEYMDYLNANYFVRYSGQRFAYDRAAIYVNEWEPNYYRPIYDPYYPSWTVYGNTYIDYPWGASVYVNGIYWGCAPLYIPRIAVGWHTITVYDSYGYCWESGFHVSRYNTVVFDRTVIQTSPSVKSKYKEVRQAGYRNPVNNGYPDFKSKTVVNNKVVNKNNVTVNNSRGAGKTSGSNKAVNTASKRYVRGSTRLVKTDRGFETDAAQAVIKSTSRERTKTGSTNRVQNPVRQDAGSKRKSSGTSSYRNSGSSYKGSGESSGYYQKKSGSSSKRSIGSSKGTVKSGGSSSSVGNRKSSKSSGSSSGTYRRSSGSSKSSGSSSGTYKRTSGSSKSSGKSSGTYKRSSGSSKSSGSTVKPSPRTKSSSGSKVKSSSPRKSSGGSKATESSPSPKRSSSSKSKGRG